MKRSTIAILIALLTVVSCIFASCNANDSILGDDTKAQSSVTGDSYSAIIRELENQIVELKQNQYILDSERDAEIARLEELISDLKEEQKNTSGTVNTDKGNGTEGNIETSQGTEAQSEAESSSEGVSQVTKFLYALNGDKATITGYVGSDKVLTIPSKIDGYTVVAIADSAFDSDTLTNVVIPNTVTKIGWFAFKECSSLKSVTVPESVTSIGYSAFPSASKNFSIICPADSFASRYAESYGISYTKA